MRNAKPNSRQKAYRLGHSGERLTILLLRLRGYSILARRFRCPAGEIDIVARRGEMLAMVEVKARRNGEVEVLSVRQQQRIARAATFFIAMYPQFAHCTVRCDIAIIRPWRWPQLIFNAWQIEGNNYG